MPLWTQDGQELFYRPMSVVEGVRQTLRSIGVSTTPSFTFSQEQRVPIGDFLSFPYYRSFDITPDGERLLVVLQAIDAGGKDGTIRSVFDGVNPQGVKVTSFKKPSAEELAHDYLWRVHHHTPAAGEIAIFNRSHYEDVLVVRVHGLVPEPRWRARYRHIREWERMLHDEGTTIVKLFLHISKDEQRERLQERIDDPTKRWKWHPGDLAERQRWDDYQLAFAEAIAETSTDRAPWFVIPANRNWFRNLVVSGILVETLEAMAPRIPEAPPGVEGTVVA